MALCTVSGAVYMPTGEVARGRVFVFTSVRGIYADNLGVVLSYPVWARTNRDGQLSVQLLTGVYTMRSGDYSARLDVPDALAADFEVTIT